MPETPEISDARIAEIEATAQSQSGKYFVAMGAS